MKKGILLLLLSVLSIGAWAETSVTDVLPKGATTIFNAKYQYGERGEGNVWPDAPANDGNDKAWYDKEFDDSGWDTKKVPFGSGLSGDQKWEGEYNCYWLRINFNLDAVDNTATYYFLCRHDDTYKAYINGHQVADRAGWTGDGYCYVPIDNSYLSAGTNVIAVYIQQNYGGSYFDCGVQKYNYQQSDFDTRFKGVAVADGEYYLYNPASGLWLQNNDRIRSDWNTRAELGTRGLDFTLTQQNNGGYYLNGKFNSASCHTVNAGNRYLDTNCADAWHFEKVNVPGLTNAYKVTYWPTDQNDYTLTAKSQSPTASTNLFTPTVSNDIFLDCFRTGINDYSIWVLVTKEQRMIMMMNGTNAAPQDATWLIKNADLADVDDRASAWQKTGNFEYNGRNNDDNTRFGRVYESFNTENVEFSQTISNLPAGKYRMRVQGFYRGGEAKMFAGTTEQAMLNSDTMDDMWAVARSMYYDGAYIGPWMEFTHNGGDLKLGIKKGAKASDTDWIIFSKFALEYMGTEDMSDLDTVFYPYNGNSFDSHGFYSYLFDGNLDTKWECWPNWDNGSYYSFADDNGNALFASSEPIYVNGLTLYTAGDTQTYPNRNPYEWSLYGTNDESVAFGELSNLNGWEEIEHVGHAQMPATNKEGKYYKFNPSQKAYKYFRFHVNRLVGKDELQLAELELDYSTTAKAPTTAIADGGSYGGEGSANLFDGPSKTKWCKGNNASTNWVVFKTANPVYATNYTIQTANDASGRDPKTFKLYGASDSAPTTDGSTDGWTEIDSEADASGTIPEDRYAFADFTIDNPGVYQYYMLKVEANRSNDASFQMSELILDGNPDFVIISTDEEMAEFANRVNNGSPSLSAVLTADVNSSTSVGTTANKYTGTFDGQGHTVTLSISTTTEFQGLIGCATGGAVIKNVIAKGSVSGSARCAGILGGSQGGGNILIENCGNEASVTTTGVNAGGVHGCNNGSAATYTLINCYNTGTIKGSNESAGISGWLGSNATVTNCYNIGDVTGVDGDNRSFARWSGGTYTNCYNKLDAGAVGGRTDNYPMNKVTSGELCFRLNGDTNDGTPWTQTIGTDGHPIPFPTQQTVHQANTDSYTNLPVSADNVVQISNADELVKFSAEVNNGNMSMDAELTADIDMTGKSNWWPIGGTDATGSENNGDKAYKGTFDGNRHTIDNLVQDDNTNKNQGLFGVVNGGCVIKNLILGSGCHFKGSQYVGAFVGSSRGAGWVTIQNCGNEGTVTASGNNAAAYIGCVVHGGPATRITDCYNRGNVSGNAESAILTGWFGGHGSVEVNNFYNTGTITGHDGGQLYRNNTGITFNNVYHTSGNQGATTIGDGWIASGELCYKLGESFKQDLSQENYPIPFGSMAVSAGKWFHDDVDDVYYNLVDGNYIVWQLNMDEANTKYEVPENVTAKNVSIARSIPAGQWIGLCLPISFDEIPDGWDVRELTSVVGSGESASMKFSAASSIVAGKPYLINPEAEVSSITATDKTIAPAETTTTLEEGGVNMIGNLAQTAITTGSFYITKSSELKKLTAASANLKGFRVYFTVDGDSDAKLSFDFADDATGIESLISHPSSVIQNAVYDLQGRKVADSPSSLISHPSSRKGIYIVNGKKVIK